jgi:hypothetical protein
MSNITKTLNDKDFDTVFTEVKHSQKLNLLNPSQLRLFCLNTQNNQFRYTELKSLLLKNIGRYIYTRAQMDKFKENDELEVIAAKAIAQIKSSSKGDSSWISGEFGNLLLYAFLEHYLKAPKLFNRLDIKGLVDDGIDYGGVHLLENVTKSNKTSFEVVFGKSNIVEDLRDAIDNAFYELTSETDTPNVISLLDQTVFEKELTKREADKLKEMILPSKGPKPTLSDSYGIFLGYTLGISGKNIPVADYNGYVNAKMLRDIEEDYSYIYDKIVAAGLDNHSFYVYIIPLNDAEIDKLDIMNSL